MERIVNSGRSSERYLFAETATIGNVVDLQSRRVQEALNQLPARSILDNDAGALVAEFVDHFRLDVPVIDRSRVVELPRVEIDVDVSGDRRRFVRDRRRPVYVKGTAVRISVPYRGDPKLFRYGTSPYNNPIPGEVGKEAIILTHSAEHLDGARATADLEGRLDRIEKTLAMIREPAEQFNARLILLVREYHQRRQAKLESDRNVTLGYPAVSPSVPATEHTVPAGELRTLGFDLFISHASEDKEAIARPLYAALTAAGVSVWFDEAELRLGDSLRRKIDDGLTRCRYGVVILSPRFFAKPWPQRELDGLVARETASGEEAILPIWHDVDHNAVLKYSSPLADRFAGRTQDGIPALVAEILRVLGR